MQSPSKLEQFITQHARPYNPEKDDYRRPPFALPVKASKSNPVYNIHRYHTKVPHQGIEPYIKHYSDPGDLILDPFCGSGMTGVAAINLKHPVILNDLSPAAVHIAYNYSTYVDVEAIRNEYKKIIKAVKDEFDWLYGTTCDRCNNFATIIYTIWSDVLECDRCGQEIILWDVAVKHDEGKIHKDFKCPRCLKQHAKKGLRWIKSIPVLTCYECHHCKPSRVERPTTDLEKERIREIETLPIPYWFPTTPFDQTWEMWRGVHRSQGITDISKFFTHRNLWAVSRLWKECNAVNDELLASKLRFAFTGVVQGLTKRCQYLPGKTSFPMPFQSGTLYIPSYTKEYNSQVAYKNKLLLRVVKLPANENSSVVVNTGSATDLPIPDNIIDYIFTDPPFGSNIFYADMNLLWEAWLGQFTDETLEAVVHVKHKNKNTLDEYSQLMSDSFQEMYRVLKPGRWASVVFHNSNDRIWQVILDAIESSGFDLAEINAFDKVQLSFKGLKGQSGTERVTNKDIVINLRKPYPSERMAENRQSYLVDSDQCVIEAIADYLSTNPAPENRTLQQIWNHALYDMLHNGSVQVSMADLEEMLAYHYKTFKIVDGCYYLRGESVVGGNIFDLSRDAGAIAWLNTILSNEPQTTGDLIPKWQKESAHLISTDSGRLDRLLEQNFLQDKRTGRWRLPTSAEREKMSARADLSSQAHLRVVRRFLDGDLGYRPNDRELAAWVRFCYNREFYSEAIQLFEHIDEARLNAEEYKSIKKMTRVAKIRSG